MNYSYLYNSLSVEKLIVSSFPLVKGPIYRKYAQGETQELLTGCKIFSKLIDLPQNPSSRSRLKMKNTTVAAKIPTKICRY